MSINQIAIIVNENEQLIKELAQKMHVWVAATGKNKATVQAIWKVSTPEKLNLTHYDVPYNATPEEMCVAAMDLVDDHYSSVFDADDWLEIQVHGCELTEMLTTEFQEFENIVITKQSYGFNVTRMRV